MISEQITCVPKAKMQWAHYFRNVITPYLVAIEGWPTCTPFTNLSTVSSTLPDLELLLRMWESGSIFWKRLSVGQYEALRFECDAKLNSGELVQHTHRTHSDKGQKRSHKNKSHRAFKSSDIVPTDTEDEDSNSGSPHNPAATMHTLVTSTPPNAVDTSTSASITITNGPTPHSALVQTSSSSQVPESSAPTQIPEIDPQLVLNNLNKSYGGTMWAQNGDNGYAFDFVDDMSFGN